MCGTRTAFLYSSHRGVVAKMMRVNCAAKKKYVSYGMRFGVHSDNLLARSFGQFVSANGGDMRVDDECRFSSVVYGVWRRAT